MSIHPIILREVRVAMRSRNLRRSRLAMGMTAAGICALFALLAMFAPLQGGRVMHHLLFCLALYAAVVAPAISTISLFSDERASQTLEFLFLAGMTSIELFTTKLLGGIIVASVDLLALAPVLAVPMLCGGVSLDLYIATIATLPILLLVTISTSILCSVACKDDSVALLTMMALVATICLATPAPFFLGKHLAGAAPFSSRWLALSPAYGPYFVAVNATVPARFWLNLLVSLGWAVLALSCAALILNHSWRPNPAGAEGKWAKRWEAITRGTEGARAELKEALLFLKPFEWLVRENRKPLVIGWIVVGVVVSLWLAGFAMWPRLWPSATNLFLTAVVLLCAADWIAIHAAARHFADARRGGALELLLTTPLSTAEITDGLVDGVRNQMKPLRRTILYLCITMALGGIVARSWPGTSLITYVAIWAVLLIWCCHSASGQMTSSSWVALNTGRTLSSITRATGSGWQIFWIMFQLKNVGKLLLSGSTGFPRGSTAELVIVGFVALILMIIFVAVRDQPAELRKTTIENMRALASMPVPDRSDPRLKKWNWKEPFLPM